MEASFIRSFRKTLRRFERLNHSVGGTCCGGVTMAQCHALLEIEEKKETTTVELAGVLDLDKSTLSRTVDGLARLGLIERRPHPTDRRFTLLAPTPAGKKTCEKIHREADDTYLRAFRKIARSRWDEIGRSFEVLATALSECGQAQGKQKSCCT